MTVMQIIVREESNCEIDLDKVMWVRVPDGFTVRRTDDCDEDYVVSETDFNDHVGGIDFEVMSEREMVTESEALWAMMLWEFAIDESVHVARDDAATMEWLKDGEGAYQARDNALLIAKQAIPASDWAYANGFDRGEDWEFIPKLMQYVLESCDNPAEVKPVILMECAKAVVREYLEEQNRIKFRNYYKHCGVEWNDEWSCMCNDRCPECNKEIEPYKSEDLS